MKDLFRSLSNLEHDENQAGMELAAFCLAIGRPPTGNMVSIMRATVECFANLNEEDRNTVIEKSRADVDEFLQTPIGKSLQTLIEG